MLNPQGSCVPVSCGNGFFFSTTAAQCVPLPQNCVAADPFTQTCAACSHGSSVDSNGVCVSRCPSGKIFVNNDCYTLPPNCRSLNYILQCADCDSSFTIKGGECVACLGPNPSFPCVECPIGQMVNTNGLCVVKGENCGAVSQVTGLCETCVSGAAP